MRSLIAIAMLLSAASAAANPFVAPEADRLPSGCYTIKAKSTGKYVSYNGPHVPFLNANRPEAKEWEAFLVQHIHEISLLVGGGEKWVKNPKVFRLIAHDGSVIRATRPGIVKVAWHANKNHERWRVKKEGDYYSLFVRDTHNGEPSGMPSPLALYMSADKALDGLITPKNQRRDWELFTIKPTTGCHTFK